MKTHPVTTPNMYPSITNHVPLRERPNQVTHPITERILEAAYHCAKHYEEVALNLAEYGMWISREVYHAYKLAYHNSISDPF
jgi:hypothetical protein